MDRFVFSPTVVIPADCIEESKKLREFIMKDMHIMISLVDTYLLWSYISNYDTSDSHLHYGRKYEDSTFEELIREAMSTYGCIVHDCH